MAKPEHLSYKLMEAKISFQDLPNHLPHIGDLNLRYANRLDAAVSDSGMQGNFYYCTVSKSIGLMNGFKLCSNRSPLLNHTIIIVQLRRTRWCLPKDRKERSTEFHIAHFVHGDVRDTNILMVSLGLCCFDWEGVNGEVRYPMYISIKDLVFGDQKRCLMVSSNTTWRCSITCLSSPSPREFVHMFLILLFHWNLVVTVYCADRVNDYRFASAAETLKNLSTWGEIPIDVHFSWTSSEYWRVLTHNFHTDHLISVRLS